MITKLIRAGNIIELQERIDRYLEQIQPGSTSKYELIFHHVEYFGNPDIATPLAAILILELKRKTKITSNPGLSFTQLAGLMIGLQSDPGSKKTWDQRMEEIKKQKTQS